MKKIIAILAIVTFGALAFAQEAQTDDNVILENTVVTDESNSAVFEDAEEEILDETEETTEESDEDEADEKTKLPATYSIDEVEPLIEAFVSDGNYIMISKKGSKRTILTMNGIIRIDYDKKHLAILTHTKRDGLTVESFAFNKFLFSLDEDSNLIIEAK